MTPELILFWPILLPLAGALLVLLMPRRMTFARGGIVLLATLANLWMMLYLFREEICPPAFQWCAGIEFALRLYKFSAFFLLAVAVFAFLVTLYCLRSLQDRNRPKLFFAYLLISVAMANGILLADHLVVLLFFWEGLLGTTFGMISLGSKDAYKTAIKAFIIVGITDLIMLFGIALTGWLPAHRLVMHPDYTMVNGVLVATQIHLETSVMGCLAAVFLIIGAISKAGSVPFHTWIPDAAVDAPLPFMAFFPASLEKLLGIYLLARITLDMFHLTPGSWLSWALMIVGAVGLLLAVMMALVQKNYKRLLSYHAISQVGYMILGIGTAVPAGIIGGLFHMINNALYKSCLFLTGGSVEKQAGTADLAKLGGLARRMPVTFACFFICALSISGCPPFNGFFSKELIYDAAKSQHVVFYLAALLGTFLTAASFLKLGHSVYFGKRDPSHDQVKEAPFSMLLPMIVIAAACVVFGVWAALPVNHLGSITTIPGKQIFAGLELHWLLAGLAVFALAAALVHHLIGAKAHGGGLHAVDHVRNASLLKGLYDGAEKRYFDPYNIGWKLLDALTDIAWVLDRGVDWIYNQLIVGAVRLLGLFIRTAHTGSYATYVGWALVGAAVVIIFMLRRM